MLLTACHLLPDGEFVWESSGDAGLPEGVSADPGGENRLHSRLQHTGDPCAVQGKSVLAQKSARSALAERSSIKMSLMSGMNWSLCGLKSGLCSVGDLSVISLIINVNMHEFPLHRLNIPLSESHKDLLFFSLLFRFSASCLNVMIKPSCFIPFFSPIHLSLHLLLLPFRSCCFLSEDRSSTMPITSNSTAASVPTTSRSRRSWKEVHPLYISYMPVTSPLHQEQQKCKIWHRGFS